jgi:metal-sulfur cluster biosynthetic enzyme
VDKRQGGTAVNIDLEERVTDRPRAVIDPEIGADVVRMRLVENLEADDEGMVRYTFRPSSPLCPLAVTLALQIQQVVARVPGVACQEISVEGYVGAEGLAELLREAQAEVLSISVQDNLLKQSLIEQR